MKAIVPAAGQGTRLYPQTHTTPKPMIRLAGKPLLGHILESLAGAGVHDIVIVVGSMKEQVIQYATDAYGDDHDLTFVEQETPEGLGHAIYQAAAVAHGDDLFIVLGDMLFTNSYGEFLEQHRSFDDVDGSIGIKEVDEPQHYGIATLDESGRIVNLAEKPDDPNSNLAISGAYVIEDSGALFDELEYLIENGYRGSGNEYQLTDALDRMVDDGATFRTFDVGDWYDCGRPETLLEANRALLEETTEEPNAFVGESVVIPPVDVGENVALKNSVIGPHVSVDDGTEIEHSLIADSIIGMNSTLEDVHLEESIVGANTSIEGQSKRLNVGDSSSVQL